LRPKLEQKTGGGFFFDIVVEKAADEIRPRPGHRAGGFFVQATKYSENVYLSSYSFNQETISSNEWIEVKSGRRDTSGSGKVVTHHMARIEANLDIAVHVGSRALHRLLQCFCRCEGL